MENRTNHLQEKLRLFGRSGGDYSVNMSRQSFIHTESLSETLDAMHEAFFTGAKITASDRKIVARWIAARQGLPGAYGNTFAGFDSERRNGIRLFTGERITSASARHILGQEACRVLIQLNVRDKVVQQALEQATDGLMQCLARSAADPRRNNPGLFCCGKCTVGLWRHLAVGGLDRQEERLKKGIQSLRPRRDDRGGWRTFPFWYTVLLLAEVDTPAAHTELRYVSPTLQHFAKRTATSPLANRRRSIAERALKVM